MYYEDYIILYQKSFAYPVTGGWQSCGTFPDPGLV